MENNYSFLKKLLGVLLIFFGILGLFLPFLQGIIFIIAGLALLGNKRLLEFIKKYCLRCWLKIKNYFK